MHRDRAVSMKERVSHMEDIMRRFNMYLIKFLEIETRGIWLY